MAEFKIIPIANIIVSEVKIRELKEDSERYNDLVRSVAVHGVKQPICVKPLRDRETGKLVPNMYSNIEGLHRISALKKLGKTEVPCMVQAADLSEEDEFAIQLTCNLHRVPQSIKEVLEHVKKYMFRHPELDREQIAKIFTMTYEQLTKLLGLDRLVKEAQTLLEGGKIKASAAYVLSTIPTEYQHEIKLGEDVSSPVRNSMSMPLNDFIEYCQGLKKALGVAQRAGKSKLEAVINPRPISKVDMVAKWGDAQHMIETTDPEADDFSLHKGRLSMIEEILQVDPASLTAQKEAKDEAKKSTLLDRAKKRKEEADKQYAKAMEVEATTAVGSGVVEGIA